MQAYIPWLSDLMHDRSAQEKLACSKPRTFIDVSYLNKLKRGRSDSHDSSDASPTKRLRECPPDSHTPPPDSPNDLPHQAQATTTQPADDAHKNDLQDLPSGTPQASPPADMSQRSDRRARVQQKIEHQINLEILLKHNELRLIEQELAKCQVSLEQLRRCNIVPFPGEQSSPITPEQISSGTGAALRPSRGQHWPSSPAPWGVTDGPYARHYARWLIPDSRFDSAPSTPVYAFGGKSVSGDARSTRNSLNERASFGSSRGQRAASNINFQVLAGIVPPPKDRHGPLITKRGSDGQTVKLVCKFCNKENISSVQGFLNHCRIAHDKNYESHGAAVEDCGQLLEPGEVPPAHTPTTEQPSPIVATPTTTTTFGRTLVHPLITGPRKLIQGSLSAPTSAVSTPVREVAQHVFSKSTSSAQPLSRLQNVDDGPFVPSPQAPRLSALMQKRGITGDLRKLVATAKVRCDLEQVVSLADDDASDDVETPIETPMSSQTMTNAQGPVGMRLPAAQMAGKFAGQSSTNAPADSLSQATNGHETSRDQVSPCVSQDVPRLRGGFQNQPRPKELEIPQTPASVNDCDLSPHTVDTNPGLLTDRDEDDDIDYEMHSDSDRSTEDVRVRVNQYGDEPYKMDMDEVHDTCVSTQAHDKVSQGNPGQALANAKRGRGRPSKRGRMSAK